MYLGLYVWTESKAAGMGAPSSPVTPGHSWLCLDCWSYVALWSAQEKTADKETLRQVNIL